MSEWKGKKETPCHAKQEELIPLAWRVLQQLVLHVEDKPVQTRFWLFISCCQALFRMHLWASQLLQKHPPRSLVTKPCQHFSSCRENLSKP